MCLVKHRQHGGDTRVTSFESSPTALSWKLLQGKYSVYCHNCTELEIVARQSIQCTTNTIYEINKSPFVRAESRV